MPLSDGNIVYVPQICGNISLVHHRAGVAVVPHRPTVIAGRRTGAKFVPALGVVAETPVSLAPPARIIPLAGDDAPVGAAAAPLAPAAAAHGVSPFFYAIPAVFAAIVAGATHHDLPTLPSCDQGSKI